MLHHHEGVIILMVRSFLRYDHPGVELSLAAIFVWLQWHAVSCPQCGRKLPQAVKAGFCSSSIASMDCNFIVLPLSHLLSCLLPTHYVAPYPLIMLPLTDLRNVFLLSPDAVQNFYKVFFHCVIFILALVLVDSAE